MKKLSERNKTLLLTGGKQTGSMLEGYLYVEEQLDVDEANELEDFCEWVDINVGGCSQYNIDMLFQAFKNPKDASLQLEVLALRKQIERPAFDSYAAREAKNKDRINKLYENVDGNAGEAINTLLCEYLSENEVKAILLRILMRDEAAVELVGKAISEK